MGASQERLQDFLDVFGIPEDEALSALISAFSPPQPPSLVQKWKQSSVYGNSAPLREVVSLLYMLADYRCQTCGSMHRITLDHINGDPKDHRQENLRVLCASCNRGKSSRPTRDFLHNVKVYKAAIDLRNENDRFPSNGEIRKRSGVRQLGGAKYLVDFLRWRLGESRCP